MQSGIKLHNAFSDETYDYRAENIQEKGNSRINKLLTVRRHEANTVCQAPGPGLDEPGP